jgi:MiaB/RimO family radical SAM methylthiotransferase
LAQILGAGQPGLTQREVCNGSHSEANMQRHDDKSINYLSKDLNLKVCVTTNGCSENRIDCAKMKNFFIYNGWSVTDNISQADLILFNACGLTTVRENDSLESLRYINEHKKPSAEVIVWGCFPKINPHRLREFHPGIIFEAHQEERLEDFFAGSIKAQHIDANFLANALPDTHMEWYRDLPEIFHDLIHPRIFLGRYRHAKVRNLVSFTDPEAFFIKVSTGCLNACAYCGVRLSRGKLKSKPIEKVVEEFRGGLDKDFSQFTLIGTDLGSYGRDHGNNLVELLKAILEIEGNYKLRLPNINPRWLTEMLPELQELVRSGKIEVMGCAVQCGSNRILKLMNRHITIEDYRKIIAALKAANPAIRILTNFLVGFPGETEQEFQETLRLLDELDFAYADIHRYSPRPKTKAATMPDQIPSHVIEDRFTRLTRHYWYTLSLKP